MIIVQIINVQFTSQKPVNFDIISLTILNSVSVASNGSGQMCFEQKSGFSSHIHPIRCKILSLIWNSVQKNRISKTDNRQSEK